MREKMAARVLFVLAVLSIVLPVAAVDRYVDCSAGNDMSGTNFCTIAGAGNACRTLARAVAASGGGDVVHVTSGPCVEHDVVVSVPGGVNITGPSASAPVVMDCTGGRCFNITAATVLQFLTLTNGASATTHGGCVYATAPTQLIGVSARNCNATLDGGAVYLATTSASVGMTIAGGTFSNNTAGRDGGAVLMTGANPSPSVVRDATFVSNTARTGSGGSLGFHAGTVNVTNCAISFSNASLASGGGGGGLYADNGASVWLSGSTVSNCAALANVGGGVYVAFATSLTITSSSLVNNVAGIHGGGLFICQAPTLLDRVNMTNNLAVTQRGGAIYNGRGALTATGSVFRGNTAGNDGGALHSYASDNSFINSLIDTSFSGYQGGAMAACSGGSLTIVNTTFTANSAQGQGGSVYLNGATAVFNDTTFDGSKSRVADGGAIFGSDFTVGGRSFVVTNNAARSGAGVYMYDAVVFLPGVQVLVSGNTATDHGGGFLVDGLTNLTLTGAIFSNNAAMTGDGGAIYCKANPTPGLKATFTGVTFTNHVAGACGGSVSIARDADFFNCTITNSSALVASAQAGGGIIMYSGGHTLRVTATSLRNCSAPNGSGGGVAATTAALVITATSISGCNAGTGGGINHNGGSTLMVINSTLLSNSASFHGGGIWSCATSITISGGVFRRNSAAQLGGFFYVQSSTSTTVQNALVDANQAHDTGAGIYCYGSTLTLANSTLTGNSAFSNGGAITVQYFASATIADTIIVGCSGQINDGGALLVNGGCSMSFGGRFVTVVGSSARSGGAMNLYGTLNVAATTYLNFSGNTASQNAGAIWINSGAAITGVFSNATFNANTALGGNGGAILLASGASPTIQMSRVVFANNTASGYGGAVAAATNVSLADATFINNQCGMSGAVIEAVNGAVVTLTRPIILSNSATTQDTIFACGDSASNVLNLYTPSLVCGNNGRLVNTTAPGCTIRVNNAVSNILQCPACDCGGPGRGTCNIQTGSCTCTGIYYAVNGTCALIAPPNPINAVYLQPTVNHITLSWPAPVSQGTIVNYTLERSTSDASHFAVLYVNDGSTRTYMDSNLSPATTYYYRVSSCNGAGCSGVSASNSTTTLAAGVDFYVNCGAGNDQSGANPCTAAGNPCRTLSRAVSVATVDGVIHVTGSGTCVEHDVNINTPVTIMGASATAPTRMDCTGGRCFNAVADFSLMYFNLSNGFAIGDNGGCIKTTYSLSLDGVTFVNCVANCNGGAVDAERDNNAPNRRVLIQRSVFIANTGQNGGALFVDSDDGAPGSPPEMHMLQDVTFQGNVATGTAGTMQLNGGSVTMINVRATDGRSGDSSGHVYAHGVRAVISNSVFSNSSAGDRGGSWYLCEADVTFVNSTVDKGKAIYCGGGFYMYLSALRLIGTHVADHVGYDGAAINADVGSVLTISGSSIVNCLGRYTAGVRLLDGSTLFMNATRVANNFALIKGAISLAQSYVTVVGSTFSANTGWDYGMMYLGAASTAVVNNTLFTGNLGPYNNGGGVVLESDCALTLGGAWVAFTNNTAGCNGGAIASYGTTRFAGAVNVTISGNTGPNGGGLYLAGPFTQDMGGSVYFSGNTAQTGGAIYASVIFTLRNATFIGNSAGDGGAIYAQSINGIQLYNPVFLYNTANGYPSIWSTNQAGDCIFLYNPTGCGNSAPLARPFVLPSSYYSSTFAPGCVFINNVQQSVDYFLGCIDCCGGAAAGTCDEPTHTCTCNNNFGAYEDTCVAVPTMVNSLTLTPAVTSVQISWNLAASPIAPVNYTLQRSSPDATHFVSIASILDNNTFVDVGPLTRSTVYYYRMLTCSDVGCGVPGAAVQTTTLATLPDAIAAAPTFSQATSTSFKAQWSAPAYVGFAITAYVVRVSDSATRAVPWPCSVCASDSLTATTATITTFNGAALTPNTTYYVVVDACNAVGCSNDSPVASTMTLVYTPTTTATATATATASGTATATSTATATATATDTATGSNPTSSSPSSSSSDSTTTGVGAVVSGDASSGGGSSTGAVVGAVVGVLVVVIIVVIVLVVVLGRRKQGGGDGGKGKGKDPEMVEVQSATIHDTDHKLDGPAAATSPPAAPAPEESTPTAPPPPPTSAAPPPPPPATIDAAPEKAPEAAPAPAPAPIN